MSNSLDFEWWVLKHYYQKGIFARAGLIDILIKNLRDFAQKSNRNSQPREFDLNDNEVIAVLQLAIIAHIMMFIEDVAIICQSIRDGKIDYYKFLDKSSDEDLGNVIEKFYNGIIDSSDQILLKMLSYSDVNSFEFVNGEEKEIVGNIIKQMLRKTQAFFNKITLFRDNHIKIFRRYKHAGFPILLTQQIPTQPDLYKNFEFATLGLTSREKIDKELSAIPYSSLAIDSYENLKKDIVSFMGNVITFKMICIERKVDGLIPNRKNLFGLALPENEILVLDQVWKRIENKYPLQKDKIVKITADFITGYHHWYTNLDNNSKRAF